MFRKLLRKPKPKFVPKDRIRMRSGYRATGSGMAVNMYGKLDIGTSAPAEKHGRQDTGKRNRAAGSGYRAVGVRIGPLSGEDGMPVW